MKLAKPYLVFDPCAETAVDNVVTQCVAVCESYAYALKRTSGDESYKKSTLYYAGHNNVYANTMLIITIYIMVHSKAMAC